MESALYRIYALVVFVSEILLVRCAHSFDFWYVNNSCVNTVRQHFPWSILYLLYNWLFWIQSNFQVTKKQQQRQKQTKKKPLQGANFDTSCISSSLSQNSHRTRQTNAGDKGCVEACAERFSALRDQHWRHVVSSLSRGHFRNVFVKFSEMLGFWSFIFL